MSAVPEPENPFAGQGAVLLDIGGDVGALVVTMPAEMVDVEVEIRPVTGARTDHGHDHHLDDHHPDHHHDHRHDGSDHGHHHPHVAVVERPVQGATIPSLVFPELVEGDYELYVKETDDVRLRVEVVGGQVVTADWPA